MYERWGKRLFDVSFAILAIIVSSPLMLLVAVAVRLEDGQPAVFRQERVGRGRKNFVLYKFRSMPVSTANVPSTDAHLLRVTRVGSVIRRLNLDELPQLFNVLKGDMSIVGPRPALPSQQTLLATRFGNGAAHIRPGLTGLAQVNAFDGMPELQKANFDGHYSRRITLLGDLWVLCRTLGYLLRRPPVY
jgi:O-antigen biosynthesis protein WbqP